MNDWFIDTNYFLRLVLRDTPESSEAYALFEQGMKETAVLHSSVLVLFEINWVLKSFYEFSKQQIIDTLRSIRTKAAFVRIPDVETFDEALVLYMQTSCSLEDCHHMASTLRLANAKLATFDRKLSKTFESLLS